MTAQTEFLHILTEAFQTAKARNSSYSLRAYAKRLKLPPSTLSGVLNGKLPVSRRLATQVLEQLCIEPQKAKRITARLAVRRNSPADETSYSQVDMDQYHLLADWYYFAILSLAETKDFESNPVWISGRLGIQVRQAEIAIERLLRLELLKRSKDGKLVPTGRQFRTSTDVANLSIRAQHLQSLEGAKLALETVPVELRDVTAMTMAIDPAKIPEAKKRIAKFRRDLCHFLESGEKKEVYKVLLCLFPLSQNQEKS